MKTTLFYTAIVCAALAMIMLMFMSKCMKEKPKVNNYDSIAFANKALEVQLGYALADAQMQSERAVKAENAARKRDTIYLTRTKIIKQFAPDTCQPYLDAMGRECDTLLLAHVYSEMTKDTVIVKKDSVINLYAKKDTISQQVIVSLEAEVKQSDKKAKRAQFFSKLVTWSALVVVALTTIITTVK